jgi:predicted O-methyltransferase YrrM
MKHVYFAQDPELAIKLLDLCIEHLRINGLLLTDNAFCHGRVLEHSEYNQVKGIQTYNQTLARLEQFESILLPFRDGLWFSRRCV